MSNPSESQFSADDLFAAVKVRSFTAFPATVPLGGSCTLHWDVQNVKGAMKLTLDGVPITREGIREVVPKDSHEYRIEAHLGGQKKVVGRVPVTVDLGRVTVVSVLVENLGSGIQTTLSFGIANNDFTLKNKVQLQRQVLQPGKYYPTTAAVTLSTPEVLGDVIQPYVATDAQGKFTVKLHLEALANDFPDPKVFISARFMLDATGGALDTAIEHFEISIDHPFWGDVLKTLGTAVGGFIPSFIQSEKERDGEAGFRTGMRQVLAWTAKTYREAAGLPSEVRVLGVRFVPDVEARYDLLFGVEDLSGALALAPALVAPSPGVLELFSSAGGALEHRIWGSAGWVRQLDITGGFTSPPAGAAAGGRIHLVARGRDGSVLHSVREGKEWRPWENLGGPSTSTPAIAARDSGELDVFRRGTEGALWYRHFDGSRWGTWQSLGGNLTSAPSAIARGSEVHVFMRGEDRKLLHCAFRGTAWSWEDLGGSLTSSPAACGSGERLDVLVRGDDRACRLRTGTGDRWEEWQHLGGDLSASPAAASWGPNRLDVVHRGDDQKLYHRAWDGSGWTEWIEVIDAGSVQSKPQATKPTSPTTNPDPMAKVVEGSYQEAFGRPPTPRELADWLASLKGGTKTQVDLVKAHIAWLASPTGEGERPAVVRRAYEAKLHRKPSDAELASWVQKIVGQKLGYTQILAQLPPDPVVPKEDPMAKVVERSYQEAFGRPPAAHELAAWLASFNGATRTVQELVGSHLAWLRGPDGENEIRAMITRSYQEAFGQPPPAHDLEAWFAALRPTPKIYVDLVKEHLGWLASPVGEGERPAVVRRAYEAKLHRNPSDAELAGWVQKIVGQKLGYTQILAQVRP